MKSYELEPRYSTNEIAGKCLKCLGEHELNFCLMELLRGEAGDELDDELKERYETIVGFLKSPEFESLRSESERLLSEGRQVALRVERDNETGQTNYRLIVKDVMEEKQS
jgi:hypothetical protein